MKPFVLALTLALCALPALPARADVDDVARMLAAPTGSARAKTSIEVEYDEFEPAVVPHDRLDSRPLVYRARITGGASTARLELSGRDAPIELLDNGVAPDLVAGDSIFSGNVPPSVLLSRNPPERVNRPIVGHLQPLINGFPAGYRVNVLGAVLASSVPAYDVTTQGNGGTMRRRSDYVVNYRDDQFAADFNYRRVAQRFYLSHPDDFDFIDFIYMPRSYIQNRFHGGVRNTILGIGKPIVSDSASFGSAGRLIGQTNFPSLAFYGHNPGYLHELGHQWINHLSGVHADGGAHWPYSPLAADVMGKSGQGFQGEALSCRLTLEAGGVRTGHLTQGTTFNAWERYLMGLAAPAEVPASFTIADQAAFRSFVNAQPNWCNGQLLSVATTSVSIDNLIALHGARVPSSQTAPRRYKVATIAISIGRLLDDAEMRFLSEEARRVSQAGTLPYAEGLSSGVAPAFNAATGGRAFLETRLDAVFAGGFE